jgi:hypothetical protein
MRLQVKKNFFVSLLAAMANLWNAGLWFLSSGHCDCSSNHKIVFNGPWLRIQHCGSASNSRLFSMSVMKSYLTESWLRIRTAEPHQRAEFQTELRIRRCGSVSYSNTCIEREKKHYRVCFRHCWIRLYL